MSDLYTIRTEFGVMRGVSHDDAEMFAAMNNSPNNYHYDIEREPTRWESLKARVKAYIRYCQTRDEDLMDLMTNSVSIDEYGDRSYRQDISTADAYGIIVALREAGYVIKPAPLPWLVAIGGGCVFFMLFLGLGWLLG